MLHVRQPNGCLFLTVLSKIADILWVSEQAANSVEFGLKGRCKKLCYFSNVKLKQLFCGLALVLLITVFGCSSGEIQNFENIRIESDFRLSYLDIRIVLLDGNRKALIWSESILTPQIGVSAISESKFITDAKIYSMRQGAKSEKVYDGQLFDLRWGSLGRSNIRLLRSEIPRSLIREDPQRDTEMGIITVTVETDKQGPFSHTLENSRIYTSLP